MNNKKAKRNDLLFEGLRTLVAIAISLLLVLIVILFISDDPGKAMHSFLLGPLSSRRYIGNVIEMSIPLIFCGLALSLTFRAKQFNLVADGAFFAGAMAACLIGVFCPGPPILVTIVAMIGGTVVGAVLGWIPAIMKLKLGAMELVSSLMLNYIVVFVVRYILTNVVKDANSMSVQSVKMRDGVGLGTLVSKTRIHFGLLIVLACVVVATLFLYRNKRGYALRMTGSNEKFAFFSGIGVGSTIIGAQVLGGCIAGLGGSVEMLGLYQNFMWINSPGYGFDGVIVATLARNNPALVPIAALFLAYIRTGADILNRTANIPYEIVSIIQAPIIILIASKAFLSHFKQRALVKQTLAEEKQTDTASTT